MNTPLNSSQTRLHKLETMKDSTLRELSDTVMTGWSSDQTCYPSCLLSNWNFREVGIQDGVLLKGNKIIIPTLLHPDILQQLHVTSGSRKNPASSLPFLGKNKQGH